MKKVNSYILFPFQEKQARPTAVAAKSPLYGFLIMGLVERCIKAKKIKINKVFKNYYFEKLFIFHLRGASLVIHNFPPA